MKEKFITTIEARMTSSRLPGKVLYKIDNKTVLEILIERIKNSNFISSIIIATTTNKTDDQIEDYASKLGVSCYRGSENDVLGRLANAIKKCNEEHVIQLTGDNPLIDPKIIDYMCNYYLFSKKRYDFLTNNGLMNLENHFLPLGMDVSIFKKKDLIDIAKISTDPETREHPTLYFYREGKEKFNIKNIEIPEVWLNKMNLRLTLDTDKDFEVIRTIFKNLYKPDLCFSLDDIYSFIKKNPGISEINSNIKHNIPSGLNEKN